MPSSVRTVFALGLVLAVAGCRESPTGPTAETVVFQAQLSPANEVPPVSNAESSGIGTATISLGISRDSGGAIASAIASFQVTLSGFPPGTALTMAHVHRGGVGTNGNIVVDTGLNPGEVLLTNGSAAFSKTGIAVAPSLAQELLSTPAAFYFNVHSALNPDGMVRGQLVRQ